MILPASLHKRVRALSQAARDWLDPSNQERSRATTLTLDAPNSFTPEAVEAAISCVMARVEAGSLLEWIGDPVEGTIRYVCVLNAGNVPFVGLQDFLAVALSGHRYLGVTSRRSPYLLPAFAESVRSYDSTVSIGFADLDHALRVADTLIATGSSATTQIVSRRFLASDVPLERQLLRGTRLGAALLSGSESEEELYGLARDALLHEGRGCRNVAVVLAPSEMDPEKFAAQARRFRSAFPPHPSTRKGVARAVRFLRAVEEPFIEGDGFIVFEGDVALREPCVLRWIRHSDKSDAESWLERNAALLQVVVRKEDRSALIPGAVERCEFGCSQDPSLNWRPDGTDTIAFLRKVAAMGL